MNGTERHNKRVAEREEIKDYNKYCESVLSVPGFRISIIVALLLLIMTFFAFNFSFSFIFSTLYDLVLDSLISEEVFYYFDIGLSAFLAGLPTTVLFHGFRVMIVNGIFKKEISLKDLFASFSSGKRLIVDFISESLIFLNTLFVLALLFAVFELVTRTGKHEFLILTVLMIPWMYFMRLMSFDLVPYFRIAVTEMRMPHPALRIDSQSKKQYIRIKKSYILSFLLSIPTLFIYTLISTFPKYSVACSEFAIRSILKNYERISQENDKT